MGCRRDYVKHCFQVLGMYSVYNNTIYICTYAHACVYSAVMLTISSIFTIHVAVLYILPNVIYYIVQ